MKRRMDVSRCCCDEEVTILFPSGGAIQQYSVGGPQEVDNPFTSNVWIGGIDNFGSWPNEIYSLFSQIEITGDSWTNAVLRLFLGNDNMVLPTIDVIFGVTLLNPGDLPLPVGQTPESRYALIGAERTYTHADSVSEELTFNLSAEIIPNLSPTSQLFGIWIREDPQAHIIDGSAGLHGHTWQLEIS